MRTQSESALILMALLLFATFPGLNARADTHAEEGSDKDEIALGFHEGTFQYDENLEEDEDFENLLEEMAEEAEEVMTSEAQEFLKAHLPDAFVLLSKLEGFAKLTQEPEEQLDLLERKIDLGHIAQELSVLKENDAAEFAITLKGEQLTIKTELLSINYDDADKEAKPAIEKEIRTLLEESFAIQQKFREEDVKALEEELQELQELLVKRRENKSIIIDRHLYELLHGEDPLAW